MPTAVPANATIGRDNEMTVMIGVDPHKRSHTDFGTETGATYLLVFKI